MMMATVHSTLKVRSGRNRPSTSRAKHGKSSPCSATPPIDREAFRADLLKHIRTVRDAMYVVIVCCEASRMQNADHDGEISTVLQLYGGNKLSKAVQEAGVLLAQFDGRTDIDPESDEIGRLADPDYKQY
jgi:hypothetical protein